MGDNKISEAAVHAGAYAIPAIVPTLERAKEVARRVIEAVLPHLQGEAVAVEFDYPEFHAQGMGCGLEDRGITDRYEAMRYGFDEALDQMATILESLGPLYLHPQPAELSEVSDLMAEAVAVGDGTLHGAIDYWQDRALAAEAKLNEVSGNSGELVSDIYKVASTPGMTPIDLADWIRDVLTRNIYALAATGKQQAGEVQGVDLGQFRDSVIHECLRAHAEWQGDLMTYDEYLAAEQKRDRLLALIDGRDAGTGVG